MPTINESLRQFLAEIGPGNPRSSSSPASIVGLFTEYLNSYGHEDLSPFESKRFEREYSEDHRFCDIFPVHQIRPYHLNSFVNTFLVRKVMATRSLLKACGPLVERLARWLTEQGHWDPATFEQFRELVGDKTGADLLDCDSFTTALQESVAHLPVPEDLSDEDHLDDQFTIVKVEPGRLHLEAFGGDENLVLALSKAVTAKAKAGWSVSLELVRLRGKWRIAGAGSVYP